jgi:hypothetical protein
LPYSAFDKLQRANHAAIVENKRLGENYIDRAKRPAE